MSAIPPNQGWPSWGSQSWRRLGSHWHSLAQAVEIPHQRGSWEQQALTFPSAGLWFHAANGWNVSLVFLGWISGTGYSTAVTQGKTFGVNSHRGKSMPSMLQEELKRLMLPAYIWRCADLQSLYFLTVSLCAANGCDLMVHGLDTL